MAKPPEPLEELCFDAGIVVDAVVHEVLPAIGLAKGDGAALADAQRVILRVTRMLKGEPASERITVDKPVAPYELAAGIHGAFFLDTLTHPPTILGRYGPDSWPLSKVERALGTPPSSSPSTPSRNPSER